MAGLNRKPALLAVVAHPDDETFGMGGTLALYASRGVEVYLLCATRGEAGEVAPEYLDGYESIGRLREAELRCAAERLGVKEVFFLDHHDSGMGTGEVDLNRQALINVPLETLAAEVTGVLEQVQPRVVITHDPVGGYFHRDHIHLHRAVVQAFNEVCIPGSSQPIQPYRLYFNTISRVWLRWLVRLMPLAGRDPRRFGLNRDIDLVRIARADVAVTARIDYSAVADARQAASACHASQGGIRSNRGVSGLLRGWSRRYEVFTRGYPPPVSGEIEKDLFEGLDLNI